jgi:hypothetical protein
MNAKSRFALPLYGIISLPHGEIQSPSRFSDRSITMVANERIGDGNDGADEFSGRMDVWSRDTLHVPVFSAERIHGVMIGKTD